MHSTQAYFIRHDSPFSQPFHLIANLKEINKMPMTFSMPLFFFRKVNFNIPLSLLTSIFDMGIINYPLSEIDLFRVKITQNLKINKKKKKTKKKKTTNLSQMGLVTKTLNN